MRKFEIRDALVKETGTQDRANALLNVMFPSSDEDREVSAYELSLAAEDLDAHLLTVETMHVLKGGKIEEIRRKEIRIMLQRLLWSNVMQSTESPSATSSPDASDFSEE